MAQEGVDAGASPVPNKGQVFTGTSTDSYVAKTPTLGVAGVVHEYWVFNEGANIIHVDFKRSDDTTESLDWEVAAGEKAYFNRNAKAILVKSATGGSHSAFNIVSQSYE